MKLTIDRPDDGADLQEEDGVLRERRRRGLEEHPGKDVPQRGAAGHAAQVQQGTGKWAAANNYEHNLMRIKL